MNELIRVPRVLLENKTIGPLAKFVYLVAQVVQPKSILDLAAWSGVHRTEASKLCSALAREGWVIKAKDGRRVVPVPGVPYVVQEQMVRELHVGLSVAPHKGEFTMKKWLDYLVLPVECIDNARPAFLQSPDTGEPLEYDRYYPSHKVAFEFQGPQHFGPTKVYANQDQFRQTRRRDVMKRGLSSENEVILVMITPDDLSLEGMLRKIPSVLPRAAIDPNSPYVRELERLSAEYRAGLARAMLKESNEKSKPVDPKIDS